MTYLVHANVLSEATKPAPNPKVLSWLRTHRAELAVNPIILGELEYGILLLPPGNRRTRLESWFASGASRLRVLEMDARTASVWAQLLAKLKLKRLAMPVKYSLIAATALARGFSVATRNTVDFRNAGITLVNPFE